MAYKNSFLNFSRSSHRSGRRKARSSQQLDYSTLEQRSLLAGLTLGDSVVTFNELNYNPANNDIGGEWIELHNQLSVDVDLSGWRLAEGIDYTFAAGTTIESGEYLVVAKDPVALESSAGISGVLGGYTGSLSNGGETIHLLDLNNRVMDELIYDDSGEWPVAADGSGASLAKLGEHLGTGDPSSWTFSANTGGTPGSANSLADSPLQLSEVAAATDANFRVELHNTSDSAINLSNYSLVLDGLTETSFALSGTIGANSYVSFDQASTGFAPLDQDRLFLAGPATSIADGIRVENTARARSSELEGRWQQPSSPTFGSANSFDFENAIVINEILYHQIPEGGNAAETQSQQLLSFNSAWRYNQSGTPQSTDWALSAHAVDSVEWFSGPGLLGVENTVLNQPINTSLTLGQPTYYFETDFNFSGDPTAVTSLILNHIVDDAAVFYLNGVEVGRFNFEDTTTVEFSTSADTAVGNATPETTAIDFSNLVVGNNRFSIEVHQSQIGSSDVVMGAELIALTNSTPATPFIENPEEWIELYNNSSSAVDLSNWQLDGGISFNFAAGTTLGAGEYLVISNDRATLATKYPDITIAAGDFDGKLGNAGDLIQLVDATGNLADEVSYLDGGQFDERADGGGASLELRDPDADNSNGQAWAASESGVDSQWQTVSYTAVAAQPDGTAQIWNEFVFGLLNDGEILIDDISVIFDPGGANTELIQNGSFDNGLSTWRAGGNHRYATIVADPDAPSNQVLQLITTGSAEHILNHVETTLVNDTEILVGETYQISYRAKWVSGSNQLNSRLYFNYLPHTERLNRPLTTGTPGEVNSSVESNIGPVYQNLQQSVVTPQAGQSVSISVDAQDNDGIASVALWYSADEGAWQQTTTTFSNGQFTGTIPGFSDETVVQFYVEGTDNNGASSTFPAAGRDSRALYKVNTSASTEKGNNSLQIVTLPSDSDLLFEQTNLFSNDQIGATVIDESGKIYYDVGTRFKGSLVGRSSDGSIGFWIGFNPEDRYRGVHDSVTINRNGLKEIYAKHLLQAAGGGVASFYDDVINLESPTGNLSGFGILNLARYGDIYLDGQFEDGSDGSVFNLELLYKPTSTVGGVEDLKITGRPLTTADGQPDLTSYGDDPELYRYNFQLENNKTADDFSGLIEFVSTFDLNGQALYDAAIEIIDLDQFVRTFTANSIVGTNDTYTRQASPNNSTGHNEHNLRFFENPEDGKFLALPWDLDRSFQLATNDDLWGQFGTLSKLFDLPQVSRLFYGHAEDIINNVYASSYTSTWAAHYGDLVNDNDDFLTEHNYIQTRSAFLLGELPALQQYQITTNNGNNFPVNSDQVTLQGNGSYQIRDLIIDGLAEPVDVTWIDDSTWQVTIDLVAGANNLTIRAIDYSGNEIDSDSIIVTAPLNATVSSDNLRISEIHFNPAAPTANEIAAGFDDNDDFEFIEIYNPSSTGAINLNGVQLADGITFDFGNINLQSGERAVVVEDVDAFMARYGDSANVLGQWAGSLSNSGESVTLLDSSMAEIMSVNYGDNDPWHNPADGFGFSLVLEDPANTPVDELGKYYSWRSSTEIGGTPGAAAVNRSGVVVNEVLAHTDAPQSDSIELFNPTSAAINVGGWYLSDEGDDLLKYQISAGTVIAAGGYLVFDESDFNVTATGFALSGSEGDQVYLSQASAGVFVGLQDAVEFDATFNGESVGRLPNGTGRLTRLSSTSFGSANGQAEVGPLVISEVNYHPESPSAAALAIDSTLTDNDLEYIEVANPTSAAIDLTNWRLRGEADYDFVAGTTLAAGEAILVVSFNPIDPLNASKLAAFEAHYGITAGVTIVGGLSASLSNSTGRIALQQPDTPDLLGVIPNVVVDEIVYNDVAPWADADGTGQTLERDDLTANGNFSNSWIAATPTPGVFESPFLLGDANQDGVVNFLDISPFISLLASGTYLAQADIDGNGVVNFLDISPFINELSSQ